jgi:hypothetical protein
MLKLDVASPYQLAHIRAVEVNYRLSKIHCHEIFARYATHIAYYLMSLVHRNSRFLTTGRPKH